MPFPSGLAPAPLAPAPLAGPARRRRARSGPAIRLHVPGGAPRSTYIEGTSTTLLVNGWPGRIVSWTADEWDALGAMQPTGTMRLAGGCRALYFAD